jgi:hypothetical protein
MDWIDLTQDRDQSWTLANTVMKFLVPQNIGEILEWLSDWRLLKKGSAPWS